MTQTHHNIKQNLWPWVSAVIGQILVIVFVSPAILNVVTSESWYAIPIAERRVIASGGILVVVSGLACLTLAARYYRTHQRYNIASLLLTMLGSALLLAGGVWMMLGFNQQI